MSDRPPPEPVVRRPVQSEHGAIVRLLSVMRGGKEIREYLQRFSTLDRARFAIIKVGGAVLRDDLQTLSEALAFLQTVGLTPVVVHGAGPQLDHAMDEAGITPEKINGLRVTPPDVLTVARKVFLAQNMALVDAVRAAGARAAAIPGGVFTADYLDKPVYGLVGEPRSADVQLIESAAQAGAVPILASLGATDDGQIVNINADTAVRALVAALQPFKVVFLTDTGGVLDGAGDLITAINLATDREDLFAAEWLTGGMRVKLQEIDRLLEALPLSSSVSITTPQALATELFTHGGAGTLVRKGEAIQTVTDKQALDPARVADLLAEAFGAPPPDTWWPEFALHQALITDRYRAGAFIEDWDGVAYLDKFAVSTSARGEGLGETVWREMTRRHPKLIWRARAGNPISEYYFRQSDGAVRRGGWIVYWLGLSDFNVLSSLIDRAEARAPTWPLEVDAGA